jgi:gamma-glutamyl-gamma-aminobutyrate hydrolase PuuD
MNLVSVGNYYNVAKSFSELFTSTKQITDIGYTLKKGDVLLFGGGEDISPSFYKQKPSIHTGASNPSNRDILEASLFKKALALNIPMIGVCRGAQLVCALSGGSLFQHVNAHANGSHLMTTNEGETFNVSSAHHQMMNPMATKHEVLAWSSEVLSRVHLIEDEKDIKVQIEPEVVFFNDTNCLAIQYHPEFMNQEDYAVKYCQNLVKKYILERV